MGEFIGNLLGVKVGLVGELDALVIRIVRFFADCHLVRLSSSTSFLICLFRSLSVSSVRFSPRFRSCSSANDLAEVRRVF